MPGRPLDRAGVNDGMRADRPYLTVVALSGVFNTVVSVLATAILLPSLIRTVGLANYALWALLAIFPGVGAIIELGMSKAIVYCVARYPSQARIIMRHAWIYVAATSLPLVIGGAFALPMADRLFGATGARDPAIAQWVLATGIVIAICGATTTLCRGLLEAQGQAHLVNLGYGLLTVLQYGVALAISRFTSDTRYLILGSGTVYLLLLALHAVLVARAPLLALRRGADPGATTAPPLLSTALRTFAADLPLTVAPSASLFLFARAAPAATDYGVYDLSIKISALAAGVLSFAGVPFFAAAAQAARASKLEQRALCRKVIGYCILLGLLGIVGWGLFYVIGQPLLRVFFHERIVDLYRETSILLAGTAALAALEPLSRLQMGFGRIGRLAMIRSSVLFVMLALLATPGRHDALEHFSVALAAGYMVAAALLLLCGKYTPQRP